MKLAIRASIIYFPLVFIYKILCPEYSDEIHNTYNMWVNYFWLVTHLWNLLVFVAIRSQCIEKMQRTVSVTVIIYSMIMASLRIYLFFDIEKHYQLIDRAGLIGFGSMSIILILIYLTFKIWYKR